MDSAVHVESGPDHDDLHYLRELEAIKQLKARYCRLLDAKDWSEWRTVFTDDAVNDTSEVGGKKITGADEIVAFLEATLGKTSQPTVHHVHNPEIELTSATTATGVGAMQDVVRLKPGLNLLGYGHYFETYEKVDGTWYIKSLKLTRLRVDFFNPLISLRMPTWLNTIAARRAGR